MSKLRSVNTAFWSDTWIETLNSEEKLLFLYLITNDQTNMLGVFEISLKRISFETGLSLETLSKAFERFERDSKVRYADGWVVLINFMKHQSYNSNMKKSAIDCYNRLPDFLKGRDLVQITDRTDKGFETLCKAFGRLSNHCQTLPKVEVEYEVEDESEVEIENSTTLRGKVAPTSLSKRIEQAAKERGIANPVEIAGNGKITYTHRMDDPDTERKEELRKLKKERTLTEMERIELLRLSTDKELAPAIAKVKEVYDNFLGRDLQTHRKDGRLSVEGTYIAKIIREGYELKDFARVLRAASSEIQSDPDKVRFYTTKGLFETVDKFTTHLSKTRELV